MQWPELVLASGAEPQFRGRERIRVDVRDGEIDEYVAHLAGRNVFALEHRQCLQGVTAAVRALEIRHLVDGDWRVATPHHPGAGRISGIAQGERWLVRGRRRRGGGWCFSHRR